MILHPIVRLLPVRLRVPAIPRVYRQRIAEDEVGNSADMAVRPLVRAGAAHEGPSAMQTSGRRPPGDPVANPALLQVAPARMGQKTLACSSDRPSTASPSASSTKQIWSARASL